MIRESCSKMAQTLRTECSRSGKDFGATGLNPSIVFFDDEYAVAETLRRRQADRTDVTACIQWWNSPVIVLGEKLLISLP